MAEHQKPLCDKCGSPEFVYDSSWKEYSCKNCGWIVEDDEKTSIIKEINETKDEGLEKELNKEASRPTQVQAGDKQTPIAPHPSRTQEREEHLMNERFKRARIEGKEPPYNLVQSLLSSDNKALQSKAREDLVAVGNSTAVGLLGRILYDNNASFRKLAVSTLQKMEETRKDMLTKFLKGEQKDAAKVEMAKATLSKIGSLKFTLIQDLAAEDRQIRKLAAEALEEFHDERAVEPLIHLLRDEDRDIREIAAKALGANISGEHLEKLTAMLNDESNGVRWYVGVALIKFYKSETKAMLFIIPILILVGLFAYFVGPLIGKTSGGIDLGGKLQGAAYLMWISCVIILIWRAKYSFRISRVKQRMKDLDREQ